jgi:hypothetical protein
MIAGYEPRTSFLDVARGSEMVMSLEWLPVSDW